MAAVLGRVNTINGRKYSEDPTIFGEPGGEGGLLGGQAGGCLLGFFGQPLSAEPARGRREQREAHQAASNAHAAAAGTAAGWDLINEPRCFRCGGALAAWVQEMAGYVKALDPNHLLTVGSWGREEQRRSGAIKLCAPQRFAAATVPAAVYSFAGG